MIEHTRFTMMSLEGLAPRLSQLQCQVKQRKFNLSGFKKSCGTLKKNAPVKNVIFTYPDPLRSVAPSNQMISPDRFLPKRSFGIHQLHFRCTAIPLLPCDKVSTHRVSKPKDGTTSSCPNSRSMYVLRARTVSQEAPFEVKSLRQNHLIMSDTFLQDIQLEFFSCTQEYKDQWTETLYSDSITSANHLVQIFEGLEGTMH